MVGTEEAERWLRWLRHGARLAREGYGERARATHVIWCLLIEALGTMDAVPDQERRWLSSGTRSGGWNAVGLTRVELEEIERLRVLSAMSPFEPSRRPQPQRDAVNRAMDVLEWLRFTLQGEDQRLMRAAVLLAREKEGLAGIIYAAGRKTRLRQVTYEIRTQAVGRILRGLRESAGLVPAPDGLEFELNPDAALH